MVVVDKLSKSAHFTPVQFTYKVVQIAKILMQNIFKLHNLSKMIISNWDVKFTSAFLEGLTWGVGHSTTFQYRISPSNIWIDRKSQSSS